MESTDPWLFEGAPGPPEAGSVTLIEGTTFALSDRVGDISGRAPDGLFVRDTRVVSRWQLRLNQQPTAPVTVAREHPFAGTFVSSVLAADGAGQSHVLVVRRRAVGNGMLEHVSLVNASARPVALALTLAVASDFADLFEVKDGRASGRAVPARADGSSLRFGLSTPIGEYAVDVHADGATATPEGLEWQVQLQAHEEWHSTIEVWVSVRGARLPLHHSATAPDSSSVPFQRHERFHRDAPRLRTPDRTAREVLRRSLDDLSSLRIFDPDQPEHPVVAAGAPWFMALFGRDSLLTSLMTLPIDSDLALGTLATLAAHQGVAVDLSSEEEPGRILHEIRFGPTGTLSLGGRSAYYGTVDATPLFVILLGELVRWRGLDDTTGALVEHADRALTWMTTYGDPDGDGFLEYERKHERGLVNQGWKDSWDGVNFADGTLAEPPVALVEVQGYAYAAYRERAFLAGVLGDAAGVRSWTARADSLKAGFDDAFWMPRQGRYAVALDRDKRQVDAVTSNIGHCLWTGVVAERRAAAVAEQLMSPELFSGWGIRTLGTTMGSYDPLSYHNGSVWPHDTALCAAGLARYGFHADAARLVEGLLDAAGHFQHRLPELFGGFARDQVPLPVPYPAACSPQAWASAAPMELLRVLLGLRPGPDGPLVDVQVPPRFRPLRLENVEVLGRRYTVKVDEHGQAAVSEDGG